MGRTLNCPLCKSKNLNLVAVLPTSNIIDDYQRKHQIEVSACFGNNQELNYLNCSTCDLFFFDPPIVGDEQFYRDFQKFDWYYPEYKNEFKYAIRLIEAKDKVLEVGSGKGAFAVLLPTKRYTGLEYSESATALAQKNGVEVINESIQTYTSKHREEYDVVCHFQVLEHVPEIHEFLKSCVDALKPGGKLIISVPSYDSFSRLVPHFELDLPPHHVSRWTDKALRHIGELFGLEVLDIWHEPLQEAHKVVFASSVLTQALYKIVGKRFDAHERTFVSDFVQRASWKIAQFLTPTSANWGLYSRGISVTAVYVKN